MVHEDGRPPEMGLIRLLRRKDLYSACLILRAGVSPFSERFEAIGFLATAACFDGFLPRATFALAVFFATAIMHDQSWFLVGESAPQLADGC